MLKMERQAKILQILREKGFVPNEDFMKKFNVSLITIRRDLKNLGKQNLIKMEHGGAADVDYLVKGKEPLYNTKIFLNHEQKQVIGASAVNLIENGETIILDSGTTTAEIAKSIRKAGFNDLTVITNDLMVAKELCPDSNLNVLMLGGMLRPSYFNAYGHFTEMMLKDLKVDKYFMGVDAISDTSGIFNLVLYEVPIKQNMISISTQVIVVADSSKFNKEAPYKVCDFKDINMVISDWDLLSSYYDFFNSLGISLLIVKKIQEI